ncbi:MAG: efflux RND transporter permease subunit [bacterium]
MSLSDTSIKNPVFAWMLMLGIIVFGIIGFFRLGISQLPDVDFPVLSVSCAWEGASPEVIETQITDVLEDAIIGIQDVTEIASTSQQGESRITIQFDLNKNIDFALQEVQSRIARAQRLLPRDMDPPVINKSNPEDQPILWLALTGNRSTKDLMEYTRDHLKDIFSTVPGVGEITLGGFVDPALRVWLDAAKMRERELTVDDLISAISSEHVEVPAGYIDTGSKELNVRVVGEAGTTKEFSSIIIPARKGSPLWRIFRIGDVAEIEDGLANIRRISRTEDGIAVGIGIRKQRGTNAVAIADAVKKRMQKVQKDLPEGMRLGMRFDMTAFVKDAMREMYFVIILSIALTGLVCWLFLGSFSSAFNVFLAIPLSVCGTFFIIYLMGFTLNTFTLLGLSLVIGIVVDDAIMMLENIARHRENKESKVTAAIKGAREITFAAVAASVAILAIFVPVIFMKGIIGRYFFQFGVTISAAVMISLLGALTLTPMFCAQFLKLGHTTWLGRAMDSLMNWLRVKYNALLGVCLDNRWKVLIGSFLIFIASFLLLKLVKKEFIPPQDQGRLMMRFQMPTGSSIDFTSSVMKTVEEKVMKDPNVDTFYSISGGHNSNSGMMMLTLKDPAQRPVDPASKGPLSQQDLMPVFRKELNGIAGIARVVVQDPSLMGLTARRGFPVEFTLSGSDWGKLAALSAEMTSRMEASGLMVDVDTDYDVGMPEVRVVPNRVNAAERGVSIASIGNTINAMIGGVRAGKFTRGGRRYDVRVQLVSEDRRRPQDISSIWVRNNRGEVIRLSEVVSIVEEPTLLSITRKNRERAIRMYANVTPGKSQGEAIQAIESISKEILPEGYRVEFSGSAQTFKESFSSLYVALLLGIFVAYMVLGVQFNSFVHPFTVLLALPFSVSGAFLALAISGQSLNIYSMIGIILLMGIVKKNSILLVDFTNTSRESGMDVRAALMHACPIRLRPILMTSVATIAAAVPPALALGPGAETRIPMAIVVIGGVLVSTVLTLFVVPCAYSLLAKLESGKHHRAVHDAMAALEAAKE